MKLSTLLEIMGAGWVLLVVGALMIAIGAAYGFSEATHLPLSASLIGIGILVTIAGFVIVDRGVGKTEVQVKKLPVIEALYSPLWLIGAAVAGGIILARLTRIRRDSIVEIVTPAVGTNTAVSENPDIPTESSTTRKTAKPRVAHFIGDQLRTLGTLASGAALSLGLKALGIPPVEQLFKELLGGETEKPKEQSPAPVEQTEEMPYAYGRNSAQGRFGEPMHNGANHDSSFFRDNI